MEKPEGQPDERHIGTLIKHLLKQRSLTMRQLSGMSGMDTATISRIVNGKQQPRLSHLKQFSEHLAISLDRLIEASGYEVTDAGNPNAAGLFGSLAALRDMFGPSLLFDPQETTERIEQELAKYEQYALTEEGHRIICRDFDAKVKEVNGIGPFIEHLREMHSRYCNADTPDDERRLLGSALLYFILSADIIPDYMFPIGYLDDAIAVHLVLDRLNRMGSTAS